MRLTTSPRAAALLVATLAALAAQPAHALGWRGYDGDKIWVERVVRLDAAIRDESRPLQPRMAAACEGYLAESFKIGGVIPVWAAEAHRKFCASANGFSRATKVSQMRRPCEDLAAAKKYYAKADAKNDPPGVVMAAGRMLEIIQMEQDAYRAQWSRC